MLLLCSGPDTFRARRKAKELLAAFRAKHDPSGFSTEILPQPTLADLLTRIGTPSLFAERRMLRCDGLLESLKLTEVRQLAKRLEGDQESMILLSVETEPLAAKLEKEFSKLKLIQYRSPLLSGVAFLKECLDQATELGVPEKIAREVARRCEGDLWSANQELSKLSVNPEAPLLESQEAPGSVFDTADAYLTTRGGWRTLIHAHRKDDVLTTLVNQSRAYARVKDRETTGLHPYMVKKMSTLLLKEERVRESIQRATRALFAARQIATDKEAETLL